MRMRQLTFAPGRATQRIVSRSRHSGIIMVRKRRALERKKMQHQGGSLAGVVSGGGPNLWGRQVLCHTSRAGHLGMDKSS
jgi:hypothetical protein